MKNLPSIFLVTTLLAQTFVHVGIGVYFSLNKAYIIEQLCQNRNNPKLHCNGHCYLSKQLKKAEDGERKNSTLLKEKEELISYFKKLEPLKIITEEPSLNSAPNADYTILSIDYTLGLIQPPELV